MIFAIGTIWFWLLLTVALIFIIVSIEGDWGGTGATVAMIVTLLVLYFFGAKDTVSNLFSGAVNNPGILAISVLGYLVIGVVWSIGKWQLRIKALKESAIRDINREGYGYHMVGEYNFDVSRNKGRIISWMCYWPFSLLWTLLNDPVKRMFEYLFSRTRRIYESMSEKALKEINEAKEKAKKK